MVDSGNKPESVLVYVGLDRVGDGLLKLPFVRGLRDAFPDARITWVAGRETSVYAGALAPLVRGLIDEVIENADLGLHPKEFFTRPLLGLGGGRSFDLVIDTQRVFWVSLVLRRIPHKAFISPAGKFLLSSVKPVAGYQFPKSMQRQLLDLLELASNREFPAPETLELPTEPELDQAAAKLLPEGPVYIGIAPGAGGLPKCWPLERFIALAGEQAAKGRVPVFILGPRESDWQARIQAEVPQALFPLQAQENPDHGFDPMFTIALAKRFTVSVSNDSGTGHMFAVAGPPLVSLFGRTVPEKFTPMSPSLTIVKAQDYGDREMAAIPLEAVREAVAAAL